MIYTFIVAVRFHVDTRLAANIVLPRRWSLSPADGFAASKLWGQKASASPTSITGMPLARSTSRPQVRREKGPPVFLRVVA